MSVNFKRDRNRMRSMKRKFLKKKGRERNRELYEDFKIKPFFAVFRVEQLRRDVPEMIMVTGDEIPGKTVFVVDIFEAALKKEIMGQGRMK